MKLAVIGATGGTGRLLVDEALTRGHELTVLVRDPSRLSTRVAEQARVVVGDSTDPPSVLDLVSDVDAVISALGPRGHEPDLHTRTAKVLIDAMTTSGLNRFVGISGAGIDVPGDQKAVRDKIISKLIQLLGGSVVKDKPAEYTVWAASALNWTLVRPPRLLDGPATNAVEHDAHRSTRSTKITRADLATFLLDVVENELYVNKAPFVAGR